MVLKRQRGPDGSRDREKEGGLVTVLPRGVEGLREAGGWAEGPEWIGGGEG